MSDPVMASSTYSNSIKFYEQMSHLQGELKTYESQHFNLEEEFQRLWTQGTSVPFSNTTTTMSGDEPKNTSSSTLTDPHPNPTLAQLGHLSEKSQLLANPTNTNLRNYGDQQDRGRRARNTAILDKLQELETNASIFAARSERLRMMRNEYETLVRKYSTNKDRGQRSGNSRNTTGHPIKLTSTSVNTDISGPVVALNKSSPSTSLLTHPGKNSSLNIDIPHHPLQEEETRVTFPASTNKSRHSLEGISKQQLPPPNYHHEGHEDGLIAISDPYSNPNLLQSASHHSFLNGKNLPSLLSSSGNVPIIRKQPALFLDISSSTTTESGDWDSKLKEEQQQNPRNYQTQPPKLPEGGRHYIDDEDDDEDGTTSLSGVLSKPQSSSNYIQNISTDGSLSESTSANQLQRLLVINKRIPRMGDGGSGTSLFSLKRGESTVAATTNNVGGESRAAVEAATTTKSIGKTFMISSTSVDEKVREIQDHHPEEMMSDPKKEGDDIDQDDSMASVMDSIFGNKIPDALPHDDSALLHIAEIDEGGATKLANNDKTPTGVASSLPNRYGESQTESRTQIQTLSPQQPIYSSPPPQAAEVAPQITISREENKSVGVYEIPEQDQERKGTFHGGSGRNNKGVVINGDGLGGNGEKDKKETQLPPLPSAAGTTKKMMSAQGSPAAKLKMKNVKQGKPSARKKLKMDYDDSESEEHSEKGKGNNNASSHLPGQQDKNSSSILTALKHNQVPTKEELDAEFEDFFV